MKFYIEEDLIYDSDNDEPINHTDVLWFKIKDNKAVISVYYYEVEDEKNYYNEWTEKSLKSDGHKTRLI